MKKIKKFDDGGPTGGRFVDMGDSQVFVPDTPAAVADTPVAATMGQVPVGMGPDIGRPDVVSRQLGPMSGGAGLGGLQDVSGGRFEDTPAGARSLAMGPLAEPPRGRGIGGSLAGMGALRAAGMKKGGAVKKTTKVVKAKTATVRGHGIEQRGKTKGRFV